jgi:NAD-dependent histone deacetylase SIR2
MLATLAQEGRLLRLYTQNVDGIDTAMEPLKTQVPLHPKGPWPKTIQLHGGLEKSVCTKCGNLNPFEPHLFQGPEPPFCKNCVDLDLVRTKHAGKRSHGIGRLRPRMVLYNEFNPDDEAIGAATAADLKARPDCVIVVGTSLKVPGVRRIAREMCAVSRGRRDGFTAWINQGPEPMGVEFKDSWDLVVRGSSDDVANYVNLPKWDEKMEQEFVEVTQEVVEATKRDIQVRLPSPPKLPGLNTVEKTKGIITPTASPRRQSPALFNGIQKLKQAPLAFGKKSSTTTKVEPAESAPSKKRVKLPTKREKKQKEPNVKPINQSMRTTKVSNLPSGKPLKNIDPPASSPNLIAMKSLSPGEFRNNSDPASAQLLEEAWNHAVTSKRALSIPSTPPPPHSSQARGTISPTGVPRGMDSLIDH